MTSVCPSATRVPPHVGLILDGNRRWAHERGLSSADGHRRGAQVVHESLEWSEDLGIETLTLWLLSTDNFARPADELDALYQTISNLVRDIALAGYAVRLLGAEAVLPPEVAACLAEIIECAPVTRRLGVNVAIGYGGRREILDAVRGALTDAKQRGESLEEAIESLDDQAIESHLYTAGQATPDLLIRTSGEQRLSGFLLWQSVHAELVFTDVMWPDFTRGDLEAALEEFSHRERRFGA
ncbi:MAG: polyprenyl diphosphate synthase [Dermabacter sp.]|nr:polyprenyl diphosphate synthase [Dermabacter sp.]